MCFRLSYFVSNRDWKSVQSSSKYSLVCSSIWMIGLEGSSLKALYRIDSFAGALRRTSSTASTSSLSLSLTNDLLLL